MTSSMPPCPLQQHSNFANMLRLIGQEVEQVTLPNGGVAQIVTRRLACFGVVRIVSRGPLWPKGTDAPAKRADLIVLRQAGIRMINAEFFTPSVMRSAGYRQIMTPAHVAILDLHNARARQTGKWRNTLRKAHKLDLSLAFQRFEPRRDQWLFDADCAQQKTKKYRTWPPALTRAYATANPGMTHIITAHHANSIVAGMVFLRHGTAATYHIGWANEVGRRRAAHTLMLDCAPGQLMRLGVRYLDLGLVDTESAPGLARFKIASGADVHALGGTWLHLPGFRSRPLV